MSAQHKRTDHYPPYKIVEHEGQLAVAVPFNNEDKTRIWVRMGHDRIRVSYNSKFFTDLLDVPLDKLAMMRRQPLLWILEQNDIGKTIETHQAAVVATE